jgi:hypothetical protein
MHHIRQNGYAIFSSKLKKAAAKPIAPATHASENVEKTTAPP